MLNLERLLAPVSAERPCGEDLVFSSEIDAIVRARQADDPSLEQGAWVAELKEADWKFVARQCAQLIEKRSKDLQLAVWLAEAEARTSGLRGLADSLLLVAALCERWWDGLYPLPDEDGHERRIGNLAWMASRIAPLLREIPLTEGQPGYALRDFDVARMHGGEELAKLETAKARSSPTFYEALLRDCEHCAGALERIEHSVDERLGVDGPSFSAAKSGLQSLVLFVKPMVKPIVKAGSAPADNGQAGAGAPAAAPVAAAGAGTAGAAAPAMELRAGPPQSRTQALAQLREVAEFFRRTEPHSPVAYLAEKAAHWGEQPLHVWLRSVVKDDASFAHIEEMLGVAPPSQA